MARQRGEGGSSRVKKDSSAAAVVTRRKQVARDAVSEYGRPVAWLGGRLYFVDKSVPEEVPDAPMLLKPGKTASATGLAAARPPPGPGQTYAWRYGRE